MFGSFLSNIDMQSGSPTFGTPESGIGLLCTGQIARHFGLPFRSGGTLTSSQVPDAQAGYEALMTLMPTFLAGANWVMHSAGWLEGGLVAGYEKFIVDIELLQMMHAEFTPLEIDEESLAFGAHEEVGSGGHFLGAMHTMERFRTCFYRPLLSSSENFERWIAQRWQRRGRPGLEDLPGEAHLLRAAAARRGDPRRDGGVRRTPPQGARRLMSLTSPSSSSANAGLPSGDFVRHPRLPRPARDRARRLRVPVRARRQHHGEPAVLRPPQRPVLHAHRLLDADAGATAESLRADFAEVATRFEMTFEIWGAREPYRTLIMVSKQLHCLNDLLFRHSNGSLQIDIPVVVSNHQDAEALVKSHGLEFRHIPVTPDTKADAEAELMELHDSLGIHLVVLARYMQVLSDDVCRKLSGQAINIHHSFLPSFKGARPYHQAFDRGVKLIGATAHYVTADLDEGPIIEQDVIRVDHNHDASPAGRRRPRRRGRRCSPAPCAGTRSPGCCLDGHRTVVFR